MELSLYGLGVDLRKYIGFGKKLPPFSYGREIDLAKYIGLLNSYRFGVKLVCKKILVWVKILLPPRRGVE